MTLAKYLTDGTLDETFSEDGSLEFARRSGPSNGDFIANRVKCLSDNSIVVGGSYSEDGEPWRRVPALAKLDEDGDFADLGGPLDGKLRVFPNEVGLHSENHVSDLAETTSGAVIAGIRQFWGTGDGKGALIRLTPDLDVDPAFGDDGVVRSIPLVWGLAAGPSDTVKVLEHSYGVRGYYAPDAVTSYDSVGSPDTSFGPDGSGTLNVLDSWGAANQGAASMYSDGFITGRFRVRAPHGGGAIVGAASFGSDGVKQQPLNTEFTRPVDWWELGQTHTPEGKFVRYGDALRRFNSDGTLDQSFGPDGVAAFNGPLKGFRAIAAESAKDGGLWVIGGPSNGGYGVAAYFLTKMSLHDDCGGVCPAPLMSGGPEVSGLGSGSTAPRAKLSTVRRKSPAKKLLSLRGTSVGATAVNVAIVRAGSKRVAWHRAVGAANWTYKLPAPLKPGSYAVLARGVSATGSVGPRAVKHITITR